MTWLRALLLATLFLVQRPEVALARSVEISVSLAVPSDLMPTQICVRAEKLLVKEEVKNLDELSGREGKAAVTVDSAQACAASPWACNRCEIRVRDTGGAVCWRKPGSTKASARTLELELELDNAAIESMRVEGADVVMKVTFAESETVRVRSRGGAYYPGLAQAVTATNSLKLPLRTRCVERPLSYGKDSDRQLPDQARPKLVSDAAGDPSEKLEQIFEWRPANKGRAWHAHQADHWAQSERALVLVPEEGGSSHHTLEYAGTTYKGTLDGPPGSVLVLRPSSFSFSWKLSPFVVGRRNAEKGVRPRKEECPEAALPRYGAVCGGSREAVNNVCHYTCALQSPIDFPTPVQFSLDPPDIPPPALPEPGHDLAAERIVWQEDLRFPQAELSSLPPSSERRVYLVWPTESQLEGGKEWDAVELTGPDGKTHRLSKQTTSLVVPGMQVPATFRYEYVGRGPFQLGNLRAHGDVLVLDEPSARRRPVSVGLHAHGGAQWRLMTEGPSWSPAADFGLVALIGSSWEVTFSATLTQSSSSLRIEGERTNYELAPQARLLLSVGRRWYLPGATYLGLGLGGGRATRFYERDWAKSEPWWLGAARARFGYEVSRSVGIEAFAVVWLPERYHVNRQDVAGPLQSRSEYGVSTTFGIGLQWADIF